MSQLLPPNDRPDAIPTRAGWMHDQTGEQLVAIKGLQAAVGSEGVIPNSPKWAKEYTEQASQLAFLTPPSVEGVAKIGEVLAANPGTFKGNPTEVVLDWVIDGALSGDAAETLALTNAHYGKNIAVKVTILKGEGEDAKFAEATSETTPVVAGIVPSFKTQPTVPASAVVGTAITVTPGTTDGFPVPTLTYQWAKGAAEIAGATSASYTTVAGDYGATVSCKVKATNAEGSATATTATGTSITASKPVNTAVPAITGTAKVGSVLSSSNGTWTGVPAPTFTYKWQRGTTDIAGATAATYTLVTADAGSTVRCVVTATNAGGATVANSADTTAVTATPANTALPAITGVANVGEVLTSTTGTWTGTPTPTYTRQWLRAGATITGATAATYTLVEADIGSKISVRVNASNSAGNVNATSAETVAVTGDAPVNTVVPAITGSGTVGEEIAASQGTWTAVPAPTFSYTWKLDGVTIGGQSLPTYTPVADDAGKTLTVTVTASNLAGSSSAESTGILIQ